MTTNETTLAGANSTFSARNVPLREIGASGTLFCERDGATVRFSTPTRGEISVFELTGSPTFRAFERDGATYYEPFLSAESAPVFLPKFATGALSGTAVELGLEERRRIANLAESARVRIYFPTFLEKRLPPNALTANDLALAKLAPLQIGDRIAAFWNRSSGRFESVESIDVDVFRFELLTPLTPGGPADANVLYFDSATNSYLKSGLKITVVDPFATLSGVFGARGFARFFSDRPVGEVLKLVL